MRQKVLAIIPARGASKGLPRKNLQDLGGKPLLAWPIELARSVKRINRVVVSTEDDEIARIGKEYGAQVVKRPKDLATDETPTLPVLQHAVGELEREGFRPDIVLLLYATTPFLAKARVEEALDLFETTGCKSVMGVMRQKGNLWKRDNRTGRLMAVYPKKRVNRQFLEPLLKEAGNVYFTKREVLMGQDRLIDPGDIELMHVGEDENIDIDSWEDLERAREWWVKKFSSREEFLPVARPKLGDKEVAAVEEVLRSGWLTMGQKTLEFEKEFAKYVGARFAVAVNSCTAALHLALLANGIGRGDEVVVPALTFAATANMVVNVGAIPVFAEIDAGTFNLDSKDVEKRITKFTKAIIVVDYAGLPVDLDRYRQLAKKYGLVLIEDAAHAVGARYKNKRVGGRSHETCFSFYAIKNMTTGEGGMLTTNNRQVAEFARKMRLHGMSRDGWDRYNKGASWNYQISEAGWKYNMTDIQAALGLVQLGKLDIFLAKRKSLVARYRQGLGMIPGIELQSEVRKTVHANHLMPVVIEGIERSWIIEELAKANVGTSVHFGPLHLMSYYKKRYGWKRGDLPITERVADKILSLPLSADMELRDVDYVVGRLRMIVDG